MNNENNTWECLTKSICSLLDTSDPISSSYRDEDIDRNTNAFEKHYLFNLGGIKTAVYLYSKTQNNLYREDHVINLKHILWENEEKIKTIYGPPIVEVKYNNEEYKVNYIY